MGRVGNLFLGRASYVEILLYAITSTYSCCVIMYVHVSDNQNAFVYYGLIKIDISAKYNWLI